MLKTMHVILDRQREFFEKGIHFLLPHAQGSRRRNRNARVDGEPCHEREIRADPAWCFPVEVLLLERIEHRGRRRRLGARVKARIQELISREQPQDPLTDQQIVEQLRSEGIQIARRTVQKYRDQLGILSSRYRNGSNNPSKSSRPRAIWDYVQHPTW